VRVVLGTTEKLGVGVNIQNLLHSLIHLDAPIRPSDYQQRNGRIMRQGNLHLQMGKTIQILRIGVKQTLDVTGYQRLEIKKKFIDQVMKGDVSQRSIDEVEAEGSDSNNFSEIMASLSGSQAALAYSIESGKLRKLENASEYHDKNQVFIAAEIKKNENIIRTTGGIVDAIKAKREELRKLFPDGGVTSVTIGSTTATTPEEIELLIHKTINKQIDKEVEALRVDDRRTSAKLTTPLKINGHKFDVTILLAKNYDFSTKKHTVNKEVLYRSDALTNFISIGGSNVLTSEGRELTGLAGAKVERIIAHVDDFVSLRGFNDAIRKRETGLEKAIRDNETYRPMVGQAFPKQAELDATRQRVTALDEQMRQELAEIEAQDAADNVQAIDISGAIQ
jgi:hypothetical protein